MLLLTAVCLDAATAVGDPHIVTLDGMLYSFSGLCEYILVRSVGDAPYLQVGTADRMRVC